MGVVHVPNRYFEFLGKTHHAILSRDAGLLPAPGASVCFSSLQVDTGIRHPAYSVACVSRLKAEGNLAVDVARPRFLVVREW